MKYCRRSATRLLKESRQRWPASANSAPARHAYRASAGDNISRFSFFFFLLCFYTHMKKRIIDLRDPLPKLPEVQPHGLQDTVSREISARMGHAAERKATSGAGRPLIEWTALEYPAVERGPYWWMPPSAIALLCVLFGILVKSYLFAGFAVLALFVVLLYSRRPPREYRFAISREGVYIGERCHRWSELESFWIFEHADH